MKALRDALFHHAVRVIDLFREWDSDASGKVNKTEFAQALPSLGLTVTREQSDSKFLISSSGVPPSACQRQRK